MKESLRLAITFGGLLVSIAVAIGKFPSPHLPWVVWSGICAGFMLLAYLAIRYLSNLSRIMDLAATSEEGATRIRRDMALGMQNDLVYEQLIELYSPIVDEVNRELVRQGTQRQLMLVEMEAGGRLERYAAVGMAASCTDSLEELFGPVESANDAWRPVRFRNLADSRQRLMRKWRSIGDANRTMEDERGDNYCMTELVVLPDRPLYMHLGVATYGQIVRSSDALINELALYAYLTGAHGRRWRISPFRRGALRMSPARMLRRLPWRNRTHRECRARPLDIRLGRIFHRLAPMRADDLFMRPHDRAAGVGIAVVTLDKRQGAPETAYLGMRSSQVGTYPATNHVVPAGMCNTYGTHFAAQSRGQPPDPAYLETAMRCEFLEEWFGEKELENNRRRDWSKRVNTKWEATRGRATSNGNGSPITEEMQFTGVAFDLLNLRPEVCATAVVDTSDGELNWEFDEIGVEGPLTTMGRMKRVRRSSESR